jgi:hypothetical protein
VEGLVSGAAVTLAASRRAFAAGNAIRQRGSERVETKAEPRAKRRKAEKAKERFKSDSFGKSYIQVKGFTTRFVD